jgi:hypothetical protein
MTLRDLPDPARPPTAEPETVPPAPPGGAGRAGANKKKIDLARLRELGAAQCTEAEAAAALRISLDTLTRKMTGRTDARIAFEEGRGAGLAGLRRAQLKLAETNASVAIFLGRVYLGQNERRGGDSSESNEVATVAQHVRERLAALVFEANRLRSRAADYDRGDEGLAGG